MTKAKAKVAPPAATEDDLRRIVREELAAAVPAITKVFERLSRDLITEHKGRLAD